MAPGGGIGRFARGKVTGAGGATAVASKDATQEANLAADRTSDPSSGIVDGNGSNWMSFGETDSGLEFNDFDSSGFAGGFNDFGLQDPMEEDTMLGGSTKTNDSVAATPSTGMRMFKTAPGAKEDAVTSEPIADSLNPSGSKRTESTVTMTTEDSAGKKDSNSPQGCPLAQMTQSNTINAAASILPVGRPSFEPSNNPTAGGNRNVASFDYGNTGTASHWAPSFDPSQGLITANESTRVIPVPPSNSKRPQAAPSADRQHSRPPSAAASTWDAEKIIPATPGFSSQVSGARRSSNGQPSLGFEQRDRTSSNPGATTPVLDTRRGNLFASEIPAVTPGNETPSAKRQSNLTPVMQNASSRTLDPSFGPPSQKHDNGAAPVTPVPGSDNNAAMNIDDRDEGASSSDRLDSHGLQFEDIYAKFLGDLRDLEDAQEGNRGLLLSMQDLFATSYAECLQDQAALLDLIGNFEKTSDMADELLARVEKF